MATVDELRAAIEAGRGVLAEAIESAAAPWEESLLAPEPAMSRGATPGEPWSLRQVAEHAIGSEYYYTGMLADALQREPAAATALSLESAGEALRALDQAAQSSDAALSSVTKRDLPKPASVRDGQIDYMRMRGVSASKTVEGLLQLFACHLEDHAQQIRSAR
jgi:hypothetical protein